MLEGENRAFLSLADRIEAHDIGCLTAAYRTWEIGREKGQRRKESCAMCKMTDSVSSRSSAPHQMHNIGTFKGLVCPRILTGRWGTVR